MSLLFFVIALKPGHDTNCHGYLWKTERMSFLIVMDISEKQKEYHFSACSNQAMRQKWSGNIQVLQIQCCQATINIVVLQFSLKDKKRPTPPDLFNSKLLHHGNFHCVYICLICYNHVGFGYVFSGQSFGLWPTFWTACDYITGPK